MRAMGQAFEVSGSFFVIVHEVEEIVHVLARMESYDVHLKGMVDTRGDLAGATNPNMIVAHVGVLPVSIFQTLYIASNSL